MTSTHKLNRPIVFSRPFLIAWGVWHLLWAVGLLWISWAHPDLVRLWFAGLYSAFLPLEGAGVVLKRKKRDGLARTLSEMRQMVADIGAAGSSSQRISWKALGGYTGVVDGLVVGWIVYPMNPIVAAVLSIVVTLWLVPHFGWRERGN